MSCPRSGGVRVRFRGDVRGCPWVVSLFCPQVFVDVSEVMSAGVRLHFRG